MSFACSQEGWAPYANAVARPCATQVFAMAQGSPTRNNGCCFSMVNHCVSCSRRGPARLLSSKVLVFTLGADSVQAWWHMIIVVVVVATVDAQSPFWVSGGH
eukprot:13405083-Alexandrium_andersonii.AAC.1